MLRSHFGIENNPFDTSKISLLSHQQEVLDTINVHSQQGGFCVLAGEPGTGKTVIRNAIMTQDTKRYITPCVSRTLHTYTNIINILCEAFDIENKGRFVAKKEKKLIETARAIHARGKMLITTIDDAHLMDIECMRRLRLLFDEFPKNHNLLLIGQPELLGMLRMRINEDIRGRITYSVTLRKLNHDQLKDYIFAQLDSIALAHSTFTDDALDLICRSSEGILRRTRNLCVSALIEAVRDHTQTVDLDQVNRVLMQPHWRAERDVQSI